MDLHILTKDGNAVMVDVGKRLRQKEKHLPQDDPHVGRMLSESKGRQHEKRRCSWRSKNCRDHGCKKDSRTDSAVPSVKPYQVEIDFEYLEEEHGIRAICHTACTGRTGVEMEALTGVNTALLTIYDMCKAVDRGMEIREIHLLEKSGGKSGKWVR